MTQTQHRRLSARISIANSHLTNTSHKNKWHRLTWPSLQTAQTSQTVSFTGIEALSIVTIGIITFYKMITYHKSHPFPVMVSTAQSIFYVITIVFAISQIFKFVPQNTYTKYVFMFVYTYIHAI